MNFGLRVLDRKFLEWFELRKIGQMTVIIKLTDEIHYRLSPRSSSNYMFHENRLSGSIGVNKKKIFDFSTFFFRF